MNRIFPCILTALMVFSVRVTQAAPASALHVSDVVGTYETHDATAIFKKLNLRLLQTYKNGGFEQGDFAGTVDKDHIVGQGVVTTDEDTHEKIVRLDLICIDPQDYSYNWQARAIYKDGRVIGIAVDGAGVTPKDLLTVTFQKVADK